MRRPGKAFIGTSGYQYPHWRGVFYPNNMAKGKWFGHYSRAFDTVEINNTFYCLPEVSTFERWCQQAPENFCYTLKFSRYGSHLKCLDDPESTVRAFMERAVHLGPCMGPVLVQLKPRWHLDLERLNRFLRAVPATQRWAFEFRDPSWLCDSVFDLLRQHNAALCIHDMLPDHPYEITADWVYLRFHGEHYAGCYSHQYLSARAQRILKHLRGGMDVYAYFNNDEKGHAARNALDLQRYVKGSP